MIPTWGAAFGANAIFNSAEFRADLTHSAVPDKAAPGTTATFTRATTKTWSNNDGYLVTGVAGEIGFPGARRVDNLIRLGAAQSSTLAVAANVTMTLPAGAYQFSMGAGTGRVTFSGTGGATGTLDAVTTGRVHVAKTITAGTLIVTASVATLVDIQVVSMVAETDQTTIREYVSVGVASSPYYHGSMVDGVKCFDTDIAGNPLPTRYTYDAVSLNGVAGTYVSTPDSVAASITGDIDIRCKVSMAAWTATGADMIYVGKDQTASTRAYLFYHRNASGTPSLGWSADGSTITVVSATAATGFAAGSAHWLRVTLDVNNGAGGNTATFYTSEDGETWTQLGDPVVTAGVASIKDSNSVVELGSIRLGASAPLNGKIYRAQIYNGINGTLAVDFDASRYAGGTTLTGSTGETWTLNGNAIIHPTNSPMLGYSAEGARTNLCLQSNAFTTTWGTSGTPSAIQNVIGPDGATSAWTVTDANAGTFDGYVQTISVSAGATYCQSLFIKKAASATAYPLVQLQVNTASASYVAVIVNHVVGTINVMSGGAYVAPVASRIESFNSDYWRVQVSGTQAGGTLTVAAQVYPAASSDGTTLSAAAQGSAVFYGAQVELGSFASSYIPTTTIAVARNADVLRYSVTNISGALGGAYAEVAANWAASPAVLKSVMATRAGTDIGLWYVSSSNVLTLVDGGVGSGAEKSFTISTTPQKISATWNVAGNSSLGASGGVAGTADTFASTFAPEYIGIGVYRDGTGSQDAHWHGTLRNVRIWQRALSSSELQAITK